MRSILIILDSVGAGEMPDSKSFGDEGSNTLLHIIERCNPRLPNMEKLGLYDILGLKNGNKGTYGKARELSSGKDTLTGHFELMGLIVNEPTKTYPNGFPTEIIEKLEKAFSSKIIGNVVGSGTELIKQYGKESYETACPIVYTSADSVLQIAAHVDSVPLETLYDWCACARKIMQGGYAVDRIIARPFGGRYPNYARTPDRRDYALAPPSDTLLNVLKDSGREVIAVGKIEDIFAMSGITRSNHTKSNAEGIAETIRLLDTDFDGLLFVNLVDFDMLYGHRNDPEGYAKALEYFDENLPKIISKLRPSDILIITADHGCDPTTASTDHSREYVPVMIAGAVRPKNLGILDMSDIAATIAVHQKVNYLLVGKPLEIF